MLLEYIEMADHFEKLVTALQRRQHVSCSQIDEL